jgi:tRNA pseudouridine32 synthase / 23S rRNA pseudouridine746 synthase
MILPDPSTAAGLAAAQSMAIALVYADASLVVVNKPAGLLAVPGRGPEKQHCASRQVQQLYADALVVHRLDQATSGLMLLARGTTMQSALSQLFESRAVAKNYVAVVHGWLPNDTGSISLPLAADWPARPRQKVDHAEGKPALTYYQVLARLPEPGAAGSENMHPARHPSTRLALQPHTGRTHQLRVHLQAIGHPIVGDALYGPADGASARLLLHAACLELVHPATGEPMQWRCAPAF